MTPRRPQSWAPRARASALLLSLGVAVAVSGCGAPAEVSESDVRGPAASELSDTSGPNTSGPGTTVHVVAVGDIVCPPDLQVTDDECQQQATADLAASLEPDAVIALGDLQYESGRLEEFQRGWAPSWGRFDDIIAPVPGNHEYQSDGAEGYVGYFDTGPYYVREVGAWRVYLLDSNCEDVDCAQEAAWLTDDLAAHPTDCAVVAMHHPRWSSSTGHGSQEQVDGLWSAAVDGGVDLSLAGHDHDYERFAPIDADGRVVDAGPRATHFVVGTGGRSLYDIGDLATGSRFSTDEAFGVLELGLSPTSFDWRFVDVEGRTLDAGTQECS